MTESKTWSGKPWEPGELCGDCGSRIDYDLTCRCEHTLRTRIEELCEKLDASKAEAARLRRVEEHRDRLVEAARRHVNARNAFLESQNRYRPNNTGAICAAEEAATAAELCAALEETV